MVQEKFYLLDEIYKYISGPIIGAFLAYWFGIRGKRVDVDLQKTRELNIVLSNMLNSWQYLKKIDQLLKLSHDKSDVLLFPREYFPVIALKSGTLNDKCFEDLENSVDRLKEFDPITYFKLEGIGKRFDFIRTNYILPFLKSPKSGNKPFEILNRTFLDQLLNDIEEYLRVTSKLISKNTYEKTFKLIENNSYINIREMIDEYNFEFYELTLSLVSDDQPKPTFEKFKEEIAKDEVKNQLNRQLTLIMEKGLKSIVEIIAENEFATVDEIEQKLSDI